MKILMGCALLALMSCTSGLYQYRSVSPEAVHEHYHVIPLYVDKNFTHSQEVALEQAVDAWDYALNGSMRITIATWKLDRESDEGKATIEKIKETHEGIAVLALRTGDPILEEYNVDANTLAFVNGLGHPTLLVVVVDQIGNRNLQTILEHELGHAMGSMHTNAKSLMYPYYGSNQVPCIDKITAAQVAHYQGIELKTMNYCSTEDFQ